MKLILNFNTEHARNYSCPKATLAFCSHGEKLPRQGGLPGVGEEVTRLSKLAQTTKRSTVNTVTKRQTVDRGKVNPRVIDKSRVAGNVPGCDSTFTRLIKWGVNYDITVSFGNN